MPEMLGRLEMPVAKRRFSTQSARLLVKDMTLVQKLLYGQQKMKQPGRIYFKTDPPGSADQRLLQSDKFTGFNLHKYHHQQQR